MRTKRTQLKRAIRDQILGALNAHCVSCLSTSSLTIDHIIPVTLGGTNELSNLQVLCHQCNIMKGNDPVDVLSSRFQERVKEMPHRPRCPVCKRLATYWRSMTKEHTCPKLHAWK